MKLPKSFRPEKDLEQKTENLLNNVRDNNKLVSKILQSCEKFVGLQDGKHSGALYEMGQEFADKFIYDISHIELLAKNLVVKEEKDRVLGYYLSALINKIIMPGDVINLYLNEELSNVIIHLKRGTVKIIGDTGIFTGAHMEGGDLIIKGNVKHSLGYGMNDGKIIVEGNTGNYIANGMKEGRITVRGNSNHYTGNCLEGGILVVEGNVKDHTGRHMKKGMIKVLKNANDYTGELMEGGTISIVGNSNEATGKSMKDGDIIVKGNVGKSTGFFAKGGWIHVEGDIEAISDNCKATIYHKYQRIR